MGTISGTVHLRPARVGLLARDLTATTVSRASTLACSVWGGLYFPILTTSDPDLSRISERLALDFWYPLDDDAVTADLCDTPGFRWRGRAPWGPFDAPQDGLNTRLLSPDYLASRSERPHLLPQWDDHDPLSALYEAWLGRHDHSESCTQEPTSYCALAEAIQIAEDFPLNDLNGALAPISATSIGLTYMGDGPGSAIVLIGDNDPRDLARMWNLRALGGLIFPWPIEHPDRFEPAARAWLQQSTTQERAHTYRSGDGRDQGRYVTVSKGQHDNHVEQVVALVEELGLRGFVREDDFGYGWTGHHPVQTHEQRSFSVQVTRNDWRVDLPMPQIPLAGSRRRWPGIVVAHAEVYREHRLPPGRTLTIPAIRRLASLLDELSENLEPFRRSTGSGCVVGVQADADTVTLGLVPTRVLFARMFEPTGWSTGQSDEGRFATQLIDRLGGPDADTACQPAIREILNQVSRTSRAKPLPALIQVAETHRGDWPARPSRQSSSREYAKSVVYELLARKLLLPALTVRCPECASEVDVRPNDLAAELRCEFCEVEFPLGLALGLRGSGNPWRYKLAANIPAGRIRASLPLMAALAVIRGSHRAGSAPALPHVLGLTLAGDNWNCEIDIAAAVIDGPTTLAVVGEVKGGSDPIDSNDVANLERVQEALRQTGIDTLVLAATSRPRFSTQERAVLRRVCENAPDRLYSRGSTTPALPVVLAGPDLSRPWMSDDHPWRWGEPGDPPMAGLAVESCRRNLELDDIAYERTATGWTRRVVWADGS